MFTRMVPIKHPWEWVGISLPLFCLVAGCFKSTALSESGESVRYVTNQEAPADCQELGPVGGNDWGKDVNHAKTIARNKAGEMGANLLVVETIEKERNGETFLYLATGRAYKCPPSRTQRGSDSTR